MSQAFRATSKTGGQKEIKDERMSLLPVEALRYVSRIYAFGEKKYAAHNWRKGYDWSWSYDALQRHLSSFWAREDNDPESGLLHLGHAAFHVLLLLTFQLTGTGKDDRYVADARPPTVDEE